MNITHKIWMKLSYIRITLEQKLEPLVLLAIRIFMWDVFYSSGRIKFDSYLNDNWDSTIFLFEEVHPVPFIPAEISAVMGTAGEMMLSTLLVLGLFGRFGAAGLLVMVGVIEYSFQYSQPEYATLPEHMTWALLLLVIVVRGAGALSLDRILLKKPLL